MISVCSTQVGLPCQLWWHFWCRWNWALRLLGAAAAQCPLACGKGPSVVLLVRASASELAAEAPLPRSRCVQTAQEALSFGVPVQAGGSAAAAATSGPQGVPADPPQRGPARAAAAGGQRRGHPQLALGEQQQAQRQLSPGTSRPSGAWQECRSSRPCQAAEQGAGEGGRCTCLCTDALPMCAGFADGTLLFWRWRRRDAAVLAAAPAVAATPAGPR